MNKFYLLIIFLLSSFFLFLNFLSLKSFQVQSILLSDLATNQYSLNKEEFSEINPLYPNLAINTIPISTILSRYYLNLNDFDNAIKFGLKGVQSNPNLAYTNYFLARVYIEKNDLKTAKNYLKTAYNISPNIMEISILLLTVERILKE